MVALTYPESIVQMDLALEADAGLRFNISARSHQSLVIASYSLKPNMHMYELADVQLNGREMPSYRSNNEATSHLPMCQAATPGKYLDQNIAAI
jgi:hypothetical protein